MPSLHPPRRAKTNGGIEFLPLILALDHALARRSKEMRARLGVTALQRLVIRQLGQYPGLSPGELALMLHVDPSTLTGVLQRLVRRGWIDRRRHPHDGRRLCLGLTPRGRTFDVPDEATVEAAVSRALSRVRPHAARDARRVLAALIRELDPPRRSSRPSA